MLIPALIIIALNTVFFLVAHSYMGEELVLFFFITIFIETIQIYTNYTYWDSTDVQSCTIEGEITKRFLPYEEECKRYDSIYSLENLPEKEILDFIRFAPKGIAKYQEKYDDFLATLHSYRSSPEVSSIFTISYPIISTLFFIILSLLFLKSRFPNFWVVLFGLCLSITSLRFSHCLYNIIEEPKDYSYINSKFLDEKLQERIEEIKGKDYVIEECKKNHFSVKACVVNNWQEQITFHLRRTTALFKYKAKKRTIIGTILSVVLFFILIGIKIFELR